jgi:hypothetical protein
MSVRVRVTSAVKETPGGNTDIVTAVGEGSIWGAILEIKFLAPSGNHRTDQVIDLDSPPKSRTKVH